MKYEYDSMVGRHSKWCKKTGNVNHYQSEDSGEARDANGYRINRFGEVVEDDPLDSSNNLSIPALRAWKKSELKKTREKIIERKRREKIGAKPVDLTKPVVMGVPVTDSEPESGPGDDASVGSAGNLIQQSGSESSGR